MNKELEQKIAARKSLLALNSENGEITETTKGALTEALVDDLKTATEFDWTPKALDTTIKTIALNSNGVMGAAAELSAEGFASSQENDAHRLEGSFGTQLNVDAAWSRTKSFTPRNPKTGETMEEKTVYNPMASAKLVVKGSASDQIKKYSKEFGADLLNGDD